MYCFCITFLYTKLLCTVHIKSCAYAGLHVKCCASIWFDHTNCWRPMRCCIHMECCLHSKCCKSTPLQKRSVALDVVRVFHLNTLWPCCSVHNLLEKWSRAHLGLSHSSQVPQLPWMSVASGLGNLTNLIAAHHGYRLAFTWIGWMLHFSQMLWKSKSVNV